MKSTAGKIFNVVIVALVVTIATTFTFLLEGTDDFVCAKTINNNDMPKVVAHGGGAVYGYKTTNSLEAVENSIANGQMLIELDMGLTVDNKVVMIHDWDRTTEYYFGKEIGKKIDESQFERLKILGKFTPLTFDKLTEILDKAPNVRIVTDCKTENVKILTEIAEDYPKYIKQMVPQIYSYDEYDKVKALGFEDIIITLYEMQSIDINELLSFLEKKQICAVTVSTECIAKGVDIKLANKGYKVYNHPVDTYEEAKTLMSKGIYGVYSSYLLPREFEWPGSTYYLLDKTHKNAEGQQEAVRIDDIIVEGQSAQKIKNLWIKNSANRKKAYYIDGNIMTDETISNADNGQHLLRIEVDKADNYMEYVLVKDNGNMRILDKKYKYRAEQRSNFKDVETAFKKASSVDKRFEEVLQHSFIAKSGEHEYYNNGQICNFMLNCDYLDTQESISGDVLVPIADLKPGLGFETVTMDDKMNLTLAKPGRVVTTKINSHELNVNGRFYGLRTPAVIYAQKSMVNHEIIGFATGRTSINDKGILLVLPFGKQLSDKDSADIIQAVDNLLFIPQKN